MNPRAAIALAFFAPLLASTAFSQNGPLTVNEWGTFTSVAAEDGSAEGWTSLTPPADLPCFVYHLSALCIKCGASRVRMETPVIYFYANQPLLASVHVDLPTGLITEWYPKATQKSALQPGMTYNSNGNLEWAHVQVTPGPDPEYPDAGDRSHYYAARATDASPLQVEGQPEKVLFYRGIADFDIAIRPKFFSDGKLQVSNSGGPAIGFAMLFENRGGRIGYRVIRDLRASQLLESPDLSADAVSVRQELAGALTAAGLFPKEAAAMIETWRDSWFEEGMRIFYLVPRATVDGVLPLRIDPKPEQMQRVFVGRVEILSPAMKEAIQTALQTGDTPALAKYGRFLKPFCDRIVRGNGVVHIAPAASEFLARATKPPSAKATACETQPAALSTDQH